ncbi:B12-binding domain-containing radical SAM protein, partial [Arthrospira platensis SPKY2]
PGACGNTTINLPSLRVDAFTVGLADQVSTGRRSGLTFAPEAGTWRLRTVINKLITEDDLYAAVDAAFEQGWTRLKLYFLTGLPTETDEDTLGIAELAAHCARLGRERT